jgi:FixJ family two-component response regulator
MSVKAPEQPVVHIVDDDGDMRDSLTYLLRAEGIEVQVYSSPAEFQAVYRPEQPGCLLLDVRMPGLSGLELYERLLHEGIRVPVIFMTAYADVPMAVKGLKLGALEFFEKPFPRETLIERLQSAIAFDQAQRLDADKWTAVGRRLDSLSPREREVLEAVLGGQSNRLIAERLGVTERTVELRRASLLKKLEVTSTVELVHLMTEFQVVSGSRNWTEFGSGT